MLRASSTVEDRHAVDRASRRVLGRGVDDVVRADDERDVGGLELRVRLVHLLQLLVGNVGLGEKDVHVTRHAAGDRMDGVDHLHAPRLEQVGELSDRVLRLGDGEPVARDDDHLVRVREQDGDVLGARGADGAARVALRAARRGDDRAEGAEEDVRQGASHRSAHHLGEERARGADERAGHDEHDRMQDETTRRDRQSGERVQQRDEHGHVRTADGQDERDAEDAATARARSTIIQLCALRQAATPSATMAVATTPFTSCWPG